MTQLQSKLPSSFSESLGIDATGFVGQMPLVTANHVTGEIQFKQELESSISDASTSDGSEDMLNQATVGGLPTTSSSMNKRIAFHTSSSAEGFSQNLIVLTNA